MPHIFLDSISAIFSNTSVAFSLLISVILSVSPTTSSAISLEGKELWILKAHPIGYKDVFISKLLVNITIEGLPILLVGILLATRLGFTYLPFIILIPFLVVILTSITGLYINLLFYLQIFLLRSHCLNIFHHIMHHYILFL